MSPCARSITRSTAACGAGRCPTRQPRSRRCSRGSSTRAARSRCRACTTTCPSCRRTSAPTLAALPFDAAAFRRDAGMADGAPFIGESDRTVYERLWHRPSLALTALEGMPLATAANQLMAEARARIGVRVAPGQDAARIASLVASFVKRDPPPGVRVETAVPAAVPGWKTRADGPAFDAARRALRTGYRARCGRDRLRRLDPVRGSVRRGARRSARAAARTRGSAVQCPRGEREPRSRGLREGRA